MYRTTQNLRSAKNTSKLKTFLGAVHRIDDANVLTRLLRLSNSAANITEHNQEYVAATVDTPQLYNRLCLHCKGSTSENQAALHKGIPNSCHLVAVEVTAADY